MCILPCERIYVNGYVEQMYVGKIIIWRCNINSCKKKKVVCMTNSFSGCKIFFFAIHVLLKLRTNFNLILPQAFKYGRNSSYRLRLLNVGSLFRIHEKKFSKTLEWLGKIIETNESFFIKEKNITGRFLLQC